MPTRYEGYFAIVLHAHLPFVRHPEHPCFLEENWLFEALAECYLPLLDLLNSLMNDGVPFRISFSISPTLCEMLSDRLLLERFSRRLEALIELSDKEIYRTRHQADFRRTAEMYSVRLRRARRLFEEDCRRDVVAAFRALQDTGRVEILASAATHPILPLILRPRCLRAQIRMGIRSYQRYFHRCPNGFWLPECAYTPGLDHELAAENIRYFILDSHGILYGTPRPKYGIFAPIFCRSRVAACGRDIESSKQVWSAHSGYPGDPVYREFYRDLGYDADADYVAPYLLTGGARHDLGFKYCSTFFPKFIDCKIKYFPQFFFRLF
ncbi:MAG: hypothetical protein N3A66_08855 [Planctomycetota bacterium]|nr:hypothetical protein [Planctomycetota bacterium]